MKGYDKMSDPNNCIEILKVEEETGISDLGDTMKDAKLNCIEEKEQAIKQNYITDNSTAGVLGEKNQSHYSTNNQSHYSTNPGTIVDISEALQEQEQEQEEGQEDHIWPNKFPARIDESGYGDTKNWGALKIWVQLFFCSFSGLGYIVIHGLATIMSLVVAANRKKDPPCFFPIIFMNIICFMISIMVMYYVKKKVHGTSHNISLTLLLRYYDFAAFCMLILWAILVLYEKNLIDPTIGWVLFSISLFVVVVLSIILAAWPGTIRERFMRFFFMWPMNTDNNKIKSTKLLQILWITRQIFQIVVIVITILISSERANDWRKNKSKDDFDASLRYQAIRAFFQAGFCEEYFKFMLVAGVPFIPKYNRSKSAILHVSIVVGMAFAVIEDIMYATSFGWKAASRPIGWALHFMFAYPAAWMLTRQRDSILWLFEILFGFTVGVALHGGYDYLLFIAEEHEHLRWLALIALVMGCGGCCAGFGICCSPQTLPSEERKPKRQIQMATNRTHMVVQPHMIHA